MCTKLYMLTDVIFVYLYWIFLLLLKSYIVIRKNNTNILFFFRLLCIANKNNGYMACVSNQSMHHGVSIITIPNGSKLNENNRINNWVKEKRKYKEEKRRKKYTDRRKERVNFLIRKYEE